MAALDYSFVQRIIDGTGRILDTTMSNPNTGSYITEAQLRDWIKGQTVQEGYYYNGNFYSNSGHTSMMAKVNGSLYVDKGSNALYYCLSSAYVALTEEAAVQAIRTELLNGTLEPLVSTKAKQDQNGNVIDTTYATKAELADAVEDLEAADTDLKSAFSNLTENDLIVTDVSATWEQGRILMQNSVLTEMASTTFANCGFIETSKNLTIEVSTGFTVHGWRGAYDEIGHGAQDIIDGWSGGTIEYEYNSTFPYLTLVLQKSPSAVITAEEAQNAVRIYSTDESIFALKSSLSTLEAEVDSGFDTINETIDYLKQGKQSAPASLYLPFQSGRVAVSNNVVSVAENSAFAYMLYAPVKYGIEYTLNVPSGLDAYVCILNQNNGTYTRLENFTNAWVSGLNSVKHTVSTEMQAYYLVISVKKTAGGTITAEEASAITITYINTEDLSYVSELKLGINKSAFCAVPTGGQILYNADTASSDDFIVNAVAYDDGVIIACRSNGNVVRIGYDGTEENLLSLTGSGFDWRLCWKDSNDNVYVSPHATWGSMNVSDRGLYKLTKGAASFTKVISLYDPSSTVPTEAQNNDDTIWTMCEDASGNLYAGVYAHTIRANPAIYKSTDGGDTWAYLINFNTMRYTTGGRHIHAIIYSRWKDALYCIVGEINTIFKSTDGGTTWINLYVTLRTKGSSMLATSNGIIIGSDGAYNCEIDLLYNDDETHETVFSGWANTVFGIKQSDITGFVYAFTKIDSSVSNDNYMPPYGVLYGTKTLEAWKAGDYTSGNIPTYLTEWEEYNASVESKYPNDAIRPQHFSILISRDGGLHWEVLKAIPCDSRAAYGIWTIGEFKNGECLCGVYTGNHINGSFVTGVTNPIVISEGKHKYVSTGCDLSGEIFVRTNSSSVVTLL